LTVGHVNENKCVTQVICAIGQSQFLRESCIYRLVGAIQSDMAEALSALARECHVNLIISGEVDSAALAVAMGDADVISCLRWPCLEAASASAIEAMLYGKPIIVTDAGFYRELPDDCVIKINQNHEITVIQEALERLCKNAKLRLTLGSEALKWASDEFTAENYANKLIDIVTATHKAVPRLTATNYFVNIMNHWGATPQLANLADTLLPLQLFSDSSRE